MKSNLPTVAVIGANGFVGGQICEAIEVNAQYKVIPVVRGDNLENLLDGAEMVIHAANSAGRFSAESNPQRDFNESVEKTFNILNCIGRKPFILLSTLSCRTQMDTNYGRNRRSCELLALAQDGKIARLGPMYGGSRKKDTLHDLLSDRDVYVAPETRYAYADVKWVASRIVELLSVPAGVYELGANNAVPISELRDAFESKSEFSGKDDTQIPENCIDGPDARLVFDYARSELEDIESWR